MKKIFFLTLAVLFLTAGAADRFAVNFTGGQWDMADFLIVKSARFPMKGSFLQMSDHIVNRVPSGLTEQQLLSCHEAYCALVTKNKFSGNVTVSSRMSFDHRMAPLIVIAPELGRSEDGQYPEFRDHYEIVLFDQGINVWHHRYINGKPSWYKLAYIQTAFAPKTIYDLQVTLTHTAKGPQLTVKCDGNEFGCAMPQEFTAKEYHLGIIACEGVNRFYDFRIR